MLDHAELPNDISENNTIALTLGPDAQKYAVVRGPRSAFLNSPDHHTSVLNSKQDYLPPWQGAITLEHLIITTIIVMIGLEQVQNNS